MPPKYGRRANASGHKNASGGTTHQPSGGGDAVQNQQAPKDNVVAASNLRKLDDGVDEESRNLSDMKQKAEAKRLVELVAEAPVGYTAALPRLASLDVSNIWNDFLQAIHEDYDMSALTACLSQQLDDEDAPWNPDMLLVQLTSDMLDAAQYNDGNGANSAAAGGRNDGLNDGASMAAAGEARRRRKQLLESANEAQEESAGRRRRQENPKVKEETVAPKAPRAFATGDNSRGVTPRGKGQ
ncbi:unnamed protein product [Trypanosoma congolense IL3000]|uniref:WGS project CAEQ00000000 data, annotated contig 1194 n=1 Tax=Trypanosoma congolense (strain IL3000) TaxID=1068625 RepID=F9W4K5_TRYCI|nr:unnamed protein product [Trypanosoma congolense IL3000]